MSQLRQHRERLEESNIEVVIITFEHEEHAHNYKQEVDLPWPLVVDNSRGLYNYYGMLKASFWDLWGPITWFAYLKEIVKGHLPRRANDDIQQRGGDVLIDPTGMVRIHHIGKGPADRPDVDRILQLVEEKVGGGNKRLKN